MVSKATRNYVWQGLLDTVKYRRYFGELEKRYRRKHRSVRFVLGVSGAVTASPLVEGIPLIVSSIGGAAVVALVIWDLVYDYGRRVSALQVAVQGLTRLENQHRSLWDEVNNNSVTDTTARRRLKEIHDAQVDVVQGVEEARDDKLNDQCQEETYRLEAERYAAG